MTERPQPVRAADPVVDPLLEAFVELARSAIRGDREAAERRGKMAVVGRRKREGRVA